MGFKLSNDRDVLQQLHDRGYVDLYRPVWLDWNYTKPRDDKFEPREHVPLETFLDRVKVGDVLRHDEDGRQRPQSFYIPDGGNRAIPVTEVRLDLYSFEEGVNFLAMACPLNEEQVEEVVGIHRDPLNFGRPEKKLSTPRLEEVVQGSGKELVFSPHVAGVSFGYDSNKFLYLPFEFKRVGDEGEAEWKKGQKEVFDEVAGALEYAGGLANMGFVPRDPSATLANRVKEVLPEMYEMGLLASKKDFRSGKKGYGGYANHVRDAKLEGPKTVTLGGGGLERVPFLDIPERYEALRNGESSRDFSSFYALTIPRFGEGHLHESRTRTLPVALKSIRYREDGEEVVALGNYGLFVSDGDGMMTVAPWTDREFAYTTSNLLAEQFHIPVVPHYRRKGVKGRNGLVELDVNPA